MCDGGCLGIIFTEGLAMEWLGLVLIALVACGAMGALVVINW
jgi:hypothetical protein